MRISITHWIRITIWTTKNLHRKKISFSEFSLNICINFGFVKCSYIHFIFRKSNTKEAKLIYKTKPEFIKIAKTLSIMEDFKAGVPRGGYKGVVQTVRNGIRIFISPEDPATWQYDLKWWLSMILLGLDSEFRFELAWVPLESQSES